MDDDLFIFFSEISNERREEYERMLKLTEDRLNKQTGKRCIMMPRYIKGGFIHDETLFLYTRFALKPTSIKQIEKELKEKTGMRCVLLDSTAADVLIIKH